MIKTTLAVALLIGANASSINRKVAAQVSHDYHQYLGDQDIFVVTTIKQSDLQPVKEFWTNKTDGDYCYNLFEKYYNLTLDIHTLVEVADKTIEEYNEKCKDLCFPGYIKCEATQTCLLPADCCTATNPGYEWCLSGTPGYEVCVPDCCEEDVEVWCNDKCTRIADLSLDYRPIEGDGPHSKDTCCYQDECCDAPDTWLSRL